MIPLSVEKLVQAHRAAKQYGVPYVLGAKPPLVDSVPSRGSDCSGYVRWLVWKATDHRLVLMEGSDGQAQYGEETLQKVQYVELARNAHTLQCFLCHMRPPREGFGHIWIVCHGKAYQCSYGAGVNDKDFDAPSLVNRYDDVWNWPHT